MAGYDQVTAVAEVTEHPISRQLSDSLVVIYAPDQRLLGRRFPLGSAPLRIGRMQDNDIALADEAVSRRHARVERGADGWFVVDVGSRNGTLLNERELSGQATLARGDRLRIGSTILKYLSGEDAESAYLAEIYELTIVDHLTGLENRRAFDDALEREFSRARRYRREFSVALLDVDFFKLVNDRFGHPAGDCVLREVAGLVRSVAQRRGASAARFGGEEFALLLTEAPSASAARIAEEVRATVMNHEMRVGSDTLSVTLSIGVATLCDAHTSPQALLADADTSLYAAKRAGRNRVCTAIPRSELPTPALGVRR